MVEKEVLDLLIISDVCYVMLILRAIKVLTRYSTLACLVESPGINRRLGRWAVSSLNWTLQVWSWEIGKDNVLVTLATSIVSRSNVDEMLISIDLKRRPRLTISVPPPAVEEGESLLLISKALSAIASKIQKWTVVVAASE